MQQSPAQDFVVRTNGVSEWVRERLKVEDLDVQPMEDMGGREIVETIFDPREDGDVYSLLMEGQ